MKRIIDILLGLGMGCLSLLAGYEFYLLPESALWLERARPY